MARGENTANHPKRQVGRGNFGQGPKLSRVAGQLVYSESVTPEMEERMSHSEWLSHMTQKHGHSAQ